MLKTNNEGAMQQKAVFWFTNDLRLDDNIPLNWLCQHYQHVAFIYVINPDDVAPNNYQHKAIGAHRLRFIYQSLVDIEQQLAKLGHKLIVLEGTPNIEVQRFVLENNINALACSKPSGWFEQQTWQHIQQNLPTVHCTAFCNHTLFTEPKLFLSQQNLQSFSSFRKHIEGNNIAANPRYPSNIEYAKAFNAVPNNALSLKQFAEKYLDKSLGAPVFVGGEKAGKNRLQAYFFSTAAHSYKQTRNALDGWSNSTKLSPYLAAGNLSPRQVWQQLKAYETEMGVNDSTYWIGFELLWREYFQWVAEEQQARLFYFKGQRQHAPKTSYYSERFTKWCQGNTPYPLVNACMKELNATGFMSNRGRQIVASCLVNELAVDWRFGAAFFQQQLIDYDVASNWGNWQYLAGVGKDPRGPRQFNIEKQTQQYDPNGEYIKKWQGDNASPALDSVDAADWPIMPPKH